jgi:hypothetical protein
MSLHRIRLYAINTFIATIVALVVIDTLPQSPAALRLAVVPFLVRLGIDQGPWNLFAPTPDRVNTRLRAEITYRDGERRQWQGPEWRHVSPLQKWVGHRHREWFEHLALQAGIPAWESWCRHLARRQRPELDDADRDAEVRLIYQEAHIPPAENRPWPSIREPAEFDDGWVLTIEKLQ